MESLAREATAGKLEAAGGCRLNRLASMTDGLWPTREKPYRRLVSAFEAFCMFEAEHAPTPMLLQAVRNLAIECSIFATAISGEAEDAEQQAEKPATQVAGLDANVRPVDEQTEQAITEMADGIDAEQRYTITDAANAVGIYRIGKLGPPERVEFPADHAEQKAFMDAFNQRAAVDGNGLVAMPLPAGHLPSGTAPDACEQAKTGSVRIYHVPTEHAELVHEAEDMQEAADYLEIWNRLDNGEPSGFLAVVEVASFAKQLSTVDSSDAEPIGETKCADKPELLKPMAAVVNGKVMAVAGRGEVLGYLSYFARDRGWECFAAPIRWTLSPRSDWQEFQSATDPRPAPMYYDPRHVLRAAELQDFLENNCEDDLELLNCCDSSGVLPRLTDGKWEFDLEDFEDGYFISLASPDDIAKVDIRQSKKAFCRDLLTQMDATINKLDRDYHKIWAQIERRFGQAALPDHPDDAEQADDAEVAEAASAE